MPRILNYAESLAAQVYTCAEVDIHPHCPDERAELFRAVEQGAVELEVLNALNALVYLFKPSLVLETGTGTGQTTLAMLSALNSNGFGSLHTLEIDEDKSRTAREAICRLDSSSRLRATFHRAATLDWIAQTEPIIFDFVFFDSLIAFRHEEFALLRKRGMLSPKAVCVFHDTSRLRGATFDDFNPEMVRALDEASHGRQWLESDLSRGLRIIKMG
jgi:predicted O-methyltransferase YrrM